MNVPERKEGDLVPLGVSYTETSISIVIYVRGNRERLRIRILKDGSEKPTYEVCT